jgi:DNA polymerase III subunit gamma/tau
MSQALYRKWRPQTWGDVVGQAHVVQTLRNALRSGRIAHAYLFSGPRGTGKTTTARLLAKAVNCTGPETDRPCNACAACLAINEGRFLDLIEIDAASNTSVEDVRDLRERIPFTPSEGRFKVYIIDEVHMLSTAAFNALLKTLEEPPAHALFVLATTEVHKVPATVVSRCQRHEFRRLGVDEIAPYLAHLASDEKLHAEPEALAMIARQATGSMRDAVSLLDQMASMGDTITLANVLEVLGAAGSVQTQEFVESLAARDVARGLALIQRTVDGGVEPRQFARQVTEYLRGVLLAKMKNSALIEATDDVRAAMERTAAALELGQLVRALRAFGLAAESRGGWRPQLALELALIETLQEAPAAPAAGSPPAVRESPRAYGGPPAASGGRGTPPAHAAAPAAVSDAAPILEAPASPAAAQTQPSAAPPAAGTPAAPTAREAAGGLTLRMVTEVWDRVLATLRQRDTRAHTLFAQCQPYSLEGTLLHLAFSADLPREKAARPETVARLQGVLAELLGQSVGIRCVLAHADPARAGLRVVDGGMVDIATREMGAQAIDLP